MLTWNRNRSPVGGASSSSNSFSAPEWPFARQPLAIRALYPNLPGFFPGFHIYLHQNNIGLQRRNHLALATAYQENCTLHCIIHILFGLPEDQLLEYAKHPPYQQLARLFCQFYNLDEDDFNPKLLLQINARFSHPLDREILWGQVFRNFLNWCLDQAGKAQVQDRTFLEPEHLEILCKALNARLTIHPKLEASEFDLKYNVQAEPAFFQVDLFHTEAGGGHYDFKYENPYRNKMHNDRLVGYGPMLSPAHGEETILYPITNTIDDVILRFAEQKRIVRNVAKEIMHMNMGGPSCTLF